MSPACDAFMIHKGHFFYCFFFPNVATKGHLTTQVSIISLQICVLFINRGGFRRSIIYGFLKIHFEKIFITVSKLGKGLKKSERL